MIWRWHFYAGVFCIPFVIFLSITGSIYLFKPQIDRWVDRPYDHLHLSGQRATPEQIALAAVAAVPNASLHYYELPPSDDAAVRVIVGIGKQEFRVYVHPVTKAVLHVVDEDHRPTTLLAHLHGQLLVGRWGSYRWRQSGIRRKRILGSVKELTKGQAKKKAATCTESATATSEPESNLTVSKLIEHYLEYEFGDNCDRAVKVAKAYRYILKNYVAPQWGTYTLGAVKAVAVESWLKSIDKANGTKAKIREVFGAAYRHAMRHELHPSNLIAHARQVRKRTAVPSIFEPPEIVAILHNLEGVEPVRTAFLIAAVMGMRRGEIFGLKWADVNFDRAILHVRRSYVDGVEGPPKTESSRRPLPLPPQAIEALRAWKKESRYTDPDQWVFASEFHFGRQPLWPGTLWRRNVVPAIEAAGIEKPKLEWHTLRRSYASLLFSSGASLRVSMELMRHSTAEMTLATYAQTVGMRNGKRGKKWRLSFWSKTKMRLNGPRLDPDRILASYWTQILLVSD